MLQTALYDWHVLHGGRMVDFAGWQMPIQFTTIVEEHHAVRRKAGLFDIAHMGRLWFSGNDAVRFLDRILTNHVEQMKFGQVRYSLICREDGGILDDVLVSRFDNGCMLVVNASNRQKIVNWIKQHRDGFDIDVIDRTQDSFMLAIQGPDATELLQPHVDSDLSTLRYYQTTRGRVFDVATVISRTGYTGEDGFELIFANSKAVELWEQLIQAAGEGNLTPCGLGCRDTLRLEAGMPLYGHEMSETIDPFTVGLAFSVKLDKPDFIGKDALMELSQRTDLPRRVGLQLAGKRIAREGAELFVEDRKVGHVTSGSYSPTLEKSIATGYLSADEAVPGTKLEVAIRQKREPAEVVPLPFYKRPTS